MEILESWTLHLKEDSISFPTRKKWAWANEEWEQEWILSRLQALANQHFKPTPPKGTNFVKACALMEILESWTLHLKEDSISFPTRKKWAWANEEWEQEWILSRLQALANQHFKPTPPKGTNFVKACALMEILESWTLHLKEDSISFPTRKKWAWANEEWEQEWILSRLQALANQHFKPTPPKGTNFVKACALMEILESWTLHLKEDSISFPTRKKWAWANEEWEQEWILSRLQALANQHFKPTPPKGTNFVKACALMEILESWTLHLKEDSISFPTRKKWAWANEEWEQEWILSRLQALANQHFKPTPPKGTNFVKACALMEILESWTLHLKEDSISFPTRKKWAWANEEWEQEWIQSRLQALANQHFKPTPPKGTNFVKACALMEILESWTLHLKEDSISFPTRKKWAWANEEWEQEWILSRLQALANQHFKPTPPKGTNFVKACALMEILESWTLHLKEDSISFPTRKKWAWANEEWEQEWILSRLQALANQHFKPTPPKGTNFVKACALMEIL